MPFLGKALRWGCRFSAAKIARLKKHNKFAYRKHRLLIYTPSHTNAAIFKNRYFFNCCILLTG